MNHLASAVATNLSQSVPTGSSVGSRLGNILVIVLETRGISKSFFGVPVLSAVDLEWEAGEVQPSSGETGRASQP